MLFQFFLLREGVGLQQGFLASSRFWGLMEKLRRPSCRYWVALAGLPTARPQIVTGTLPCLAVSITIRMSFFMALLAGR